MGIEKRLFENLIDKAKEAKGVKYDTELNENDLKELVVKFKELYKKEKGEDFPQDPTVQLTEAITAVFRSWDNPRAIVYRRLNDIPGEWGTAVNVQQMVFGNKGETSGTGVAFSRNAATGEKEIYGEYLMNAQGDDVVVLNADENKSVKAYIAKGYGITNRIKSKHPLEMSVAKIISGDN